MNSHPEDSSVRPARRTWLVAAAIFMYVFSNFFLWGHDLMPKLPFY